MQPLVFTRSSTGFLAELRSADGSALPHDFLSWCVSTLCYLRRRRSSRVEFAHTGKRFFFDKFSLTRTDQNKSSVVFPAGLTRRTCDHLRKSNIDFSVVDLRKWSMPAPRIDLVNKADLASRPMQQNALALMLTSDMGIIQCPTAWGKTFLIEQLVRAYPTARILISTYRTDVCKSIFDRIKRAVPAHDVSLRAGGRGAVARVTVSTVDSLHSADPQNRDLFIFDEVHEAASPTRMQAISLVRNGRRFGLSATVDGRSDRASMAIEAMFGPVICSVSYQDAQAAGNVAEISVELYSVPGTSVPYTDDTLLARFGLWRNNIRNAIIAELATQHERLGKQVLIAVDKLEHALALKLLLPSWTLVHGPVDSEQLQYFFTSGLLPHGRHVLCEQERRDDYRKSFEKGSLRCAIATTVWSQGVDFRHLDVLLRCDAQPGQIPSVQWAGRLSRGSHGLLIDFVDAFDERLLKRSRAREKIYRGKGWNITRKQHVVSCAAG